MSRKVISSFMMCFLILAVTGYGDTVPENADASGDVYTAKAAGLIDLYSLSCSGDVRTLYISASTNGNEKMAEIGLKNIVIERSSDKINWTTERTLSDMTAQNKSVYNISKQKFDVEGDYYYRVSLEHYAKENTRWFPKEQSAANTSTVIFIPAQDSQNIISLTQNILTEDISTDDNNIIPAGSTAFTVNIEENQGFCLFGFNMKIGSGYEIITGEDGRPLFTKCKYVNYIADITGSVNGENVVFNGVFGDDCTVEGGIITFYAQENPESQDKSFSVDSRELYGSMWRDYGSGVEYVNAGCPLKSYNRESSIPFFSTDQSTYIVGDFNGDMYVNLKDVFIAHHLTYTGAVLPNNFSHMKEMQDFCLPDISDIYAAFIWNKPDDPESEMLDFSSATAHELLQYCADISAGKQPETDSYTGTVYHRN